MHENHQTYRKEQNARDHQSSLEVIIVQAGLPYQLLVRKDESSVDDGNESGQAHPEKRQQSRLDPILITVPILKGKVCIHNAHPGDLQMSAQSQTEPPAGSGGIGLNLPLSNSTSVAQAHIRTPCTALAQNFPV